MNNAKRVVINGRFLSQRITGVQRYAREVLREMDHLRSFGGNSSTQFPIEILVPRDTPRDIHFETISVRQAGFLQGHVWEQLELPFYSRGDLLVNFCNSAPLIKRNQMITIHDAATLDHPEWFDARFALWYKLLITQNAPRARAIMTDSKFSKDRLCAMTSVQKEDIHVVPIGGDRFADDITPAQIKALKEKYGITGDYLLTVGSLDPRKNLSRLLLAWQGIQSEFENVELLISGAGGRAFREALGNKLPRGARLLGYVEDEDLKILYSGAQAFVFPSLYEGFGLPPLEAMQHGCPVAVSTAASLPEVCGLAAIYFDPAAVEDIALAMRDLLTDGDLRSRLRLEGLSQSQKFSWERCAGQTFDLIKEILAL